MRKGQKREREGGTEVKKENERKSYCPIGRRLVICVSASAAEKNTGRNRNGVWVLSLNTFCGLIIF